jgi:hypothetical protein
VTSVLKPGEKLRLEKLVAYGWSGARSLPAVRDQVEAALAGAVSTGWEGLVEQQRAYLDDFWARADVEVEGDAEIQQAVRFGIFHVLQAGARAEERAIPAKGLTGSGYDGHSFWDAETFVLPAHLHVPRGGRPGAALAPVHPARRPGAGAPAGARRRRLPLAHHRGLRVLRLLAGRHGGLPRQRRHRRRRGALRRRHRRRGVRTRDRGLELLVETARLWRSLGHHDHHGRFHIDGVTGPDEYSAIADDNIYTNLMAQRTCAPRRTSWNATRTRARCWAPTTRRPRPGGTRPRPCGPVQQDAGRPRAVRRLHRPPGVGLPEHPPEPLPPAAPLPLLRPVPQTGGQAGRPGAGHVSARRRASPTRRRPATSPTTST